ncbi:MAG: hypothetical protein IKN04_18290 [Clostridia bacterium]|nr:hypothetical protein [Clostridia bacterium]
MAEVFTLDSEYLAAKRRQIRRDAAYARYKVGNTWYRAAIESADVLPSGIVEIVFSIDHTVSGNITVTGIELYDRNGTRIGSKSVSVTRQDVVEGILYVCRFNLFQVVDNASGTGAYDAL